MTIDYLELLRQVVQKHIDEFETERHKALVRAKPWRKVADALEPGHWLGFADLSHRWLLDETLTACIIVTLGLPIYCYYPEDAPKSDHMPPGVYWVSDPWDFLEKELAPMSIYRVLEVDFLEKKHPELGRTRSVYWLSVDELCHRWKVGRYAVGRLLEEKRLWICQLDPHEMLSGVSGLRLTTHLDKISLFDKPYIARTEMDVEFIKRMAEPDIGKHFRATEIPRLHVQDQALAVWEKYPSLPISKLAETLADITPGSNFAAKTLERWITPVAPQRRKGRPSGRNRGE